MSRFATEKYAIHHKKYGWSQAAFVLLGIALIGGVGVNAIYKNAESDSKKRAGAQIVSTGIPCELTSAAAPQTGGAGFVLKAQCPDGVAHVLPSLSLWIRLLEALPREQRIVKCAVRKDGKYTDCSKPEELASRDDREGRHYRREASD